MAARRGKPRDVKRTLGDAYTAVSSDLLKQLGDGVAAEAGPPMSVDVERVGDAARVEAWNTPDPKATDQALWQLAQQKTQEHSQAGMKPEEVVQAVAEDLTHARYPGRVPLYTAGTVGWAEQVREAQRLARVAARRAPPPEPPAPPVYPEPVEGLAPPMRPPVGQPGAMGAPSPAPPGPVGPAPQEG